MSPEEMSRFYAERMQREYQEAHDRPGLAPDTVPEAASQASSVPSLKWWLIGGGVMIAAYLVFRK